MFGSSGPAFLCIDSLGINAHLILYMISYVHMRLNICIPQARLGLGLFLGIAGLGLGSGSGSGSGMGTDSGFGSPAGSSFREPGCEPQGAA